MAFFARPQSHNAAVKIVTPTTTTPIQDDKLKSPGKKGVYILLNSINCRRQFGLIMGACCRPDSASM